MVYNETTFPKKVRIVDTTAASNLDNSAILVNDAPYVHGQEVIIPPTELLKVEVEGTVRAPVKTDQTD
jgi:hypothetical protein